MSDTIHDNIILTALRTKRRELEMDHVQLAGRILEINECIALIERGGARRGKPRSRPIQVFGMASVTNRPIGVEGGTAVAEAEPPAAA